MTRTIDDLRDNAVLFWPSGLLQTGDSTVPLLVSTQEKFLSVLASADATPFSWESVLSNSSLSANLFLKHLMIFADVGGERVMRFAGTMTDLFPDDKFTFMWNGNQFEYEFSTASPRWTNSALKLTNDGLRSPVILMPETKDLINLLLFAGLSIDPLVPEEIEDKCVVGGLIGHRDELDTEAKRKYLHVSRISGGAKSNALGQAAQNYVREFLSSRLSGWDFSRSTIPGISQNLGLTNTSFDIVSESPTGKYCVIEVSFQVTTNSVIERKSGQAVARKNLLNGAGHKVTYVLDGAGNFQRSSAMSNIIANSDYAVTFADSELTKLVDYIRGLG